jgi:hypothetical protein
MIMYVCENAMQAKSPSRNSPKLATRDRAVLGREDVCRSWVCGNGWKVSKSHRVEQGRDVVLRRLRGRSLLLFFRRPCEEVGVSCVGGGWRGLAGWGWKEFRFKDGATGRNEVSKVKG